LLKSIQLARGLAAFAVAYCHLCNVQHDIIGRDYFAWPSFLSFGYAGVDLFFVISGFIISFITDRGEFRASDFFVRRAIRILPIYYIFTVITWIGAAFVGKADFTIWRIVASFGVLPQQDVPIAGVGWSLEHEAIFYVIFGLTAATARRRAVIPLLCALFVVGVWLNSLPNQVWDWHLFSLFHVQFLLGVVLYEYRHLLARFNGFLLLTTGVLAFPATQYVLDSFLGGARYGGVSGLWRAMGFGLSSVFFLGGLLRLEERLRSRVFSPLIRLGDASFVLYLCHPVILSGLGRFYGRARVGEPLLFPAMLAALGVSVVFAILFHKWCERPMLDWLHELWAKKARNQHLESGDSRRVL
jgi:exopolysaccharide production protein ExoZ